MSLIAAFSDRKNLRWTKSCSPLRRTPRREIAKHAVSENCADAILRRIGQFELADDQ